jgi:hypothetical protein
MGCQQKRASPRYGLCEQSSQRCWLFPLWGGCEPPCGVHRSLCSPSEPGVPSTGAELVDTQTEPLFASFQRLSSDSECGTWLQKAGILQDGHRWVWFFFDIHPLIGSTIRNTAPSIVTHDMVETQSCYNTVRTPTLCKPDMSDKPCYFLFNLLNLATPLTTYAVHLVLLIFVLLSSLLCYLYDAVLILTSDILYSLIDTFLSILRYISTHVFVVEP